MSISPRDLHIIYKSRLIKIMMGGPKAMITVKMPMALKRKKMKYKMYKVIPLLFLYNNVMCTLKSEVQYVAFKGSRAIPITSALKDNCNMQ
jgi:hypothetical protein